MGIETTDLLWLLSWPVFIFISYKFIAFNIRHIEKSDNTDTTTK